MKIEVKNIKKRFDSILAVDGISFKAAEGKIFGLLGPNGSGKTTTIRMIMNILVPDEGEILFNDRLMTENDKNLIGYLPEERGLYKKMSVNNLLKYFSSLKGRPKYEIQKNIDYWLDRFDLLNWKNRKIRELSKGMSQKLQFIAAVNHDPDIIFLDEPFSGLDPISTEILRDSILELSKKGKTILFSTHIMEQAEKLCTNIILINHGKEVLSGSIKDIKTRSGKNSIIIEFDGNIKHIKSSKLVSDIISYPRWVEIKLHEGKSPDDLLCSIAGKISIKRFEVTEPSLNKIFIKKIGRETENNE